MKVLSVRYTVLLAAGSLVFGALNAGEITDRYQRWLDEEVVYLIAPSERKEFRSLESDAEREKFIENFWSLRDPDPSTEVNEYRQEIERRIRYANDNFHSGRPGWKTDRGRVFITHGPPDSISFQVGGERLLVRVRNPTEVLTGGSGDRRNFYPVELTRPECEIWIYRHLPAATSTGGFFQIIFARADAGQLLSLHGIANSLGGGRARSYQQRSARDAAIVQFQKSQSTVGDYEILYAGEYKFQGVDDLFQGVVDPGLAPSFSMVDFQRALKDLNRTSGEVLWKELERERYLKELVDSRVFFGEFEVEFSYGFVRAPSGSTLIPIVIGLDRSYSDDEFEILIELLRRDGSQAARIVDTMKVEPSDGESAVHREEPFVYQSRVSAKAGSYRLRLFALLHRRQAIARIERDLDVPDFSTGELMISDVLLFDRVLPRVGLEKPSARSGHSSVFLGGSSPVAVEDHFLVPAAEKRFRRKQELTALLEVYNPGVSSDKGLPSLDLDCRLVRDGLVVAVLPVRELDYLTDTGVRTEQVRRTAFGLTIPLLAFPPGEYGLEFEVHDQVADRKAAQVSFFSLY